VRQKILSMAQRYLVEKATRRMGDRPSLQCLELKTGDSILYADHDTILVREENERSLLNAFNVLTARHENAKVGCNIRPLQGWVAEHVKLNAPNLNSMTCGDHISGQRGDARSQARMRNYLGRSLCKGLRRRGFYVPELLSDSAIHDRR
jgi:hypothetical protein